MERRAGAAAAGAVLAASGMPGWKSAHKTIRPAHLEQVRQLLLQQLPLLRHPGALAHVAIESAVQLEQAVVRQLHLGLQPRWGTWCNGVSVV